MAEKNFRYSGIWGGKTQVASLGVLLVAVCGLPLVIVLLANTAISPVWLFWFFVGGLVLGVLLILGGLFAIDVKKN